MGWVLWPWGVGWKERGRTLQTGPFDCPNPRCKGKRQSQTQAYKLKQYRNWVVLFYIPVLPLNTRGAAVQCSHCKSTFSLEVLPGVGATASDLPQDDGASGRAGAGVTERQPETPAQAVPPKRTVIREADL